MRQEINFLVPERIQLCFRFLILLNLLPYNFDVVLDKLEFAAENIFSISNPVDDLIYSAI
jgi:hypothetical protein